MRKLAALLASLSLGIQAVHAEGFAGLGSMTFDGSLEVLGNQANNETDANGAANDRRGNTITRIRVGAELPKIADGVSGRVEVVRNSDNGAAVQYGSGRPTTVATEETLIAFQNAYIDIEGFLNADKFRLGRQYGGRKGDLLLYYGPNRDDALSVGALDSLLVEKKVGPVNAVFATGKAVEDDAVPGAAGSTDAGDVTGDVNVSYLILSSDELFSGLTLPLELGYYQANSAGAGTTADNRNLVIYDLRAGYGFMDGALNTGLEYAMNAGQDSNGTLFAQQAKYKGNALLLKVDYKNEDNGFGARGFYANASGDEQTGTAQSRNSTDKAFHDGGLFGASASDFRFGEILSNSNTFANAFGIGGPGLDTGANGRGANLIGLGADFTPANFADGKLTFFLDFVMAKANESAAGVSDDIGEEIDLAVKYRYSETVTASLGYARFSPDSGLVGSGAPNDEITKAWAKLKVRWGGERDEDVMKASAPRRPAPRPVSRPASAPARRR